MRSTAAELDIVRLAPFGDAVRASIVDGVRVVYASRPGPLTAALGFRVGSNDEPLPLRGVTHLIEHLALHQFDAAAQHSNGQVDGALTQFFVSGSEAQVVGLINGVCAALRDVPVGRLEAEKSVLRAEQQSRVEAAEEGLLQARFGARSLGRQTFSEYAFTSVTPDQVTEWARRWFVAENAVLWISSDTLPEGLDLRLPAGVAEPRPRIEPIDRPRPLSVPGRPRITMVDAMLPRSTETSLAVEVIRAAVFRELRRETGLSYTAHATYEPVSADEARVLVFADATDENQGAVVGAMVDALAALRAGRIDQRDFDTARGVMHDGLAQMREPGALGPLAWRHLIFGDRVLSVEELEVEVAAVTPEAVAKVAGALWDDAVWLTPGGPLDWIGAQPVSYSSDLVEGRWFEYIGSRERLVVGPTGVSWVHPDRSLTVRFDSCELYAAASDGGRMLVGDDGVTITVEPELLREFGAEQIAELDAHIPESLRVNFPGRVGDQLPQPPAVELPPRARDVQGGALVAGAIVFTLMSIVAAPFVPVGSLFIGLSIVGVLFATQRVSTRRTQYRQWAALYATGSAPGAESVATAVAVKPTRELFDFVTRCSSPVGATRRRALIRRVRHPILVVDRHVLTVLDDDYRAIVTVPTHAVTSVVVAEYPERLWFGLRVRRSHLCVVAEAQGVRHEVMILPMPASMVRVGLQGMQEFCQEIRVVLGRDVPPPAA